MRKIQLEVSFDQRKVTLDMPMGEPVEIRIRATIACIVVCLTMFALSASSLTQTVDRTRRSHLELRSSNTPLVQSFNWARQQAMAYVFGGDPVGPWYGAALPGRRAFCMRDVSHQVAGAQIGRA